MQKQIQNIIQKISADGADKFHVLADFDRTLTKNIGPDGTKVSSLISVLRDEGYLTPDYSAQAKALFTKYHPIEIDSKISKHEKKKAMQDWWTNHYDLLIKSKLNKKDVEKAVQSQRVQFRKGIKEFLKFLSDKKIPLVIMSSSGLGGEAIELYLKNKNLMSNNIYIISNEFIWNKNGDMAGVKQPIIHVLNKDETMLKDFPFYNKVINRKNVLLLGDSVDDIDMIIGFEYENLLKIGFLNEPNSENQSIYKKNYDMLILDDGTFEKVNEIIKQTF
jgi:5'-nucleotidase